jgi:hypothetical protein
MDDDFVDMAHGLPLWFIGHRKPAEKAGDEVEQFG